jgi:hypothetical protein
MCERDEGVKMVLSSIFAAIPSRLAHLRLSEGALTSLGLKLGTRTFTVAPQCRNYADIPPDDSLACEVRYFEISWMKSLPCL